MKITLAASSDGMGGAGIAALRLHKALLSSGIDCSFAVDFKTSDQWGVTQIGPKRVNKLKLIENIIVAKVFRSHNRVHHSIGLSPSSFPKWLSMNPCDLVHLHWINNGFLKVSDLHRIQAPLVWTMHDMWALCGAEHYPIDDRWKSGYQAARPSHEKGADINRWMWRKKKRSIKSVHLICPSRWMLEMARQSPLTCDCPATVIPNAIDTDAWAPLNKQFCRKALGIDESAFIVGFGAVGGKNDPRKGADLLDQTLGHLLHNSTNLLALVFGQGNSSEAVKSVVPTFYAGRLHDELSLRIAYGAMDALVIPSRLDNLPNTGLEALASGTPVYGFNVGGLSDIVTSEVGGLANQGDPEALSYLISECGNPEVVAKKSDAARERAIRYFSNDVVANLHTRLYEAIVHTP